MIKPNVTHINRVCPWCGGCGRIAPGVDCGPCMGTGGTVGSLSPVGETRPEHQTHKMSDDNKKKREAALVVLSIVVRL